MSSAALAPPDGFQHVRQTRVSAKVREAVRLMVEEALPRAEAASKAGITEHGLYKALRSPSVSQYRNGLMKALRESAASRSIARVDRLADRAESEHVQLKSNELLLAIEGISAVTRSESLNVHQHLVRGLVIVRGASDHPRQIEGLAREVTESKRINRIGTPCPHPAMKTAAPVLAIDDHPGLEPPLAGGHPEGEK